MHHFSPIAVFTTVHALIFNTVTPFGEKAFYVVVGGRESAEIFR